jgi:hypothetical protein
MTAFRALMYHTAYFLAIFFPRNRFEHPGSFPVLCPFPGLSGGNLPDPRIQEHLSRDGIVHKSIGRDVFAYYGLPGKMRDAINVLLDGCPGEEVRDTPLNRVIDLARRTVECPFHDLLFILLVNGKVKVPLAHRAAENREEGSLHTSSLISIIWATSGPVEMRVTGAPISSSAFSINWRAFRLSLS